MDWVKSKISRLIAKVTILKELGLRVAVLRIRSRLPARSILLLMLPLMSKSKRRAKRGGVLLESA